MIVNGVKHPKIKDITGKKVGILTVIQISHVDSKNCAWWLVECKCGKRKTLRTTHLICDNTQSCGCLRDYNRKAKGEYGFNILFGRYKANAFKRGIEFSLDKNQFKEIVTSSCFYCEAFPSQVSAPNKSCFSKEALEHAQFIYNGIDRVDNNIGYIIENCISCCKQCNTAKNILGIEEFYIWIDNVHKSLMSRNFIPKHTEEFVVEEVLG